MLKIVKNAQKSSVNFYNRSLKITKKTLANNFAILYNKLYALIIEVPNA